MSSSIAPLFPETGVFIPAYWATARSEILTQEEADTRYLRFPVGQGTESIPNLIVSGTSTLGTTSVGALSTNGDFNSTGNNFTTLFYATSLGGFSVLINSVNCEMSSSSVVFSGTLGPTILNAPPTPDNTSYVPTTAWVNTAIANAALGSGGLALISTTTNIFTIGTDPTIAYPSIFDTTYKRYKIIITITNPSTTNFPALNISAVSGTGTLPTAFITQASSWFSGALSQASTLVLPIPLGGGSVQSHSYTLELSGVGSVAGGGGLFFQCESMKNAYSNPGGSGNFTSMSNAFITSGNSITGFTLKLIGTTTIIHNCFMTIYGYVI